MVRLMNRSIDIVEELDIANGGRFGLNRRGYLFATADPAKIDRLITEARSQEKLGSGPARIHTGAAGEPAYQPAPAEGFLNQPTGSDLLLEPGLIQQHFPYLAENTVAALHTRRCGWFSGQQYGQHLLAEARRHGVHLVKGNLTSIDLTGGRVDNVLIDTQAGSRRISTACFVNAAGPFQKEVAGLLDIDLPVFSELHIKAALNDPAGVVSRNAPLSIWLDPVTLAWTADEREMLLEDPETRWLLEEFPAGVHTRPEGAEGSTTILMQWTYHLEPVDPVFPLPKDPYYFDIVLRGLAVPVPGLRRYFDRTDRPFIDGGYYVKTRENRPLVGPLPVEGAYIIGALSGYGMQAGSGAGELLSLHVAGDSLPGYADAFLMQRYQDPAYLRAISDIGVDSGQL